jgi:hypothetical protein
VPGRPSPGVAAGMPCGDQGEGNRLCTGWHDDGAVRRVHGILCEELVRHPPGLPGAGRAALEMTKVTLISRAQETHLDRETGCQALSWYGYRQAPR